MDLKVSVSPFCYTLCYPTLVQVENSYSVTTLFVCVVHTSDEVPSRSGRLEGRFRGVSPYGIFDVSTRAPYGPKECRVGLILLRIVHKCTQTGFK